MLNFRRSRPDYTPPFTCRFARHSAAFEKKTISDDRFPPCFAHELGREGLPGLSERDRHVGSPDLTPGELDPGTKRQNRRRKS
jgi:hypothetical protein